MSDKTENGPVLKQTEGVTKSGEPAVKKPAVIHHKGTMRPGYQQGCNCGR